MERFFTCILALIMVGAPRAKAGSYTYNIVLTTIGAWSISQASRLLVSPLASCSPCVSGNMYQAKYDLLENVGLDACTINQKEISLYQLDMLVSDVVDLHADVRILTQENLPQAKTDIEENKQERIWIVKYSRMPRCDSVSSNVIALDIEQFDNLRYAHKRDRLRYAIQHALNGHPESIYRTTAVSVCGIAPLFAIPRTTLFSNGIPWYLTCFELWGKTVSAAISGIIAGWATHSAIRRLNHIEAKIAEASAYSSINDWSNSTETKRIINRDTSDLTDCIEHYLEHGHIRWSDMASPAYWAGYPIRLITRGLELFDRPSDYLARAAQNVYAVLYPAQRETDDAQS